MKREVINMRISEIDKRKLSRAASISGTNLSSFVMQSAMEKAKDTLEHEPVIEVTPRDMKKLLDIIESNEEPNQDLKDAFQQYSEFFSETVKHA